MSSNNDESGITNAEIPKLRSKETPLLLKGRPTNNLGDPSCFFNSRDEEEKYTKNIDLDEIGSQRDEADVSPLLRIEYIQMIPPINTIGGRSLKK